MEVAHLRAVGGGAEELEAGGLFVAQRQGEAIPERDQVVALQLLLLVRRHAPLPRRTHAIALLRLREDDRGLALRTDGSVVGGMNLRDVVAAALEAVDLLV